MNYSEFIDQKQTIIPPSGFAANRGELPPAMKKWQQDVCLWSLQRGRSALFLDTGLGKTLIQLAWADAVSRHTGKPVLILCPLAVGQQTVREASKFKIQRYVTQCHGMADVAGPCAIAVTNYHKLHKFDASAFGGVVLDESSILKSHSGSTRNTLIETFAATPYRLACTATPSPNDHTEIGNHAEFLGICSRVEMLSTYFVHDSANTSEWRLKGHATKSFWEWVASWAVVARKPSDLGYPDDGFELPELEIVEHVVSADSPQPGRLVVVSETTLEGQRKARRSTLSKRIDKVAELVAAEPDEPWIVWCGLNDEADAAEKAIPGAVQVAGSDKDEDKEDRMIGFTEGRYKKLVSKSSICGFGMNWQHCARMVFAGVSHSFEQFYQAYRRCWRTGQTRKVIVHAITSELETDVMDNLKRKQRQHEEMFNEMVSLTREVNMAALGGTKKVSNEYKTKFKKGERWTAFLGDCVDGIKNIETGVVDYSVFSPPFSSLYTYSNSPRDMGNCKSDDEFFHHFRFLVQELYRVLKPGRLLSFHCMNLPTTKERDGYIGIRDFRGALIKAFEEAGFIFHSEVCIWKDPVTAMQRTKAIGLLHKQLKKDAHLSRQGIPDYLVTMRKPGQNDDPIMHYGSYEDLVQKCLNGTATLTKAEVSRILPVDLWQKYASPVWMDIDQTDTLNNYRDAREDDDERHICLAKGSLVLTRDGYKPIESIRTGDMVLTHKGRWKPVLAVAFTGVSKCVKLSAQGVANLSLTPDHRLWARASHGESWNHRKSAAASTPGWLRADESVGSYINQKLPPIEDSKLSHQEWWLVGRWLADGHLGTKGDFFISVGSDKIAEFEANAGNHVGFSQKLTAVQYRLKSLSVEMKRVLSLCGKGACSKRVPIEGLCLDKEYSSSLLNGYLSGDGHYLESRKRWTASSVSRELLLGMAMIVQRVHGSIASVYAGRKPSETEIEGRVVKTKQDWIFSFDVPQKGDRVKPFITEDGAWKKVRSQIEIGECETWCIQVEDDESFTAEGCIVKNCPLQLGVIERCLHLWSNPGDLVLSPFMGIGSEGYKAVKMGRKFVGFELKESYFDIAMKNLETAERELGEKDLFSEIPFDDESADSPQTVGAV